MNKGGAQLGSEKREKVLHLLIHRKADQDTFPVIGDPQLQRRAAPLLLLCFRAKGKGVLEGVHPNGTVKQMLPVGLMSGLAYNRTSVHVG
mgnify:CR=1 FL=1